MIDWHSNKSEIRLNPRTPQAFQDHLLNALPLINSLKDGSLCFATSGSSGNLKWVVLSKKAILCSAEAVNVHLQSTSRDIWLNPLPDFHVGGAGIQARAFLSGAQVVPYYSPHSKWSAETFLSAIQQNNATLTAIVPTQLYDLVSLKAPAAPSLRAIIVGGGVPSENLYQEALKLGWKLLLSYGLTECASQVATSPYGSWEKSYFPLTQPLQHVQLAVNEKGYLKIKSNSLLTAYIQDRHGEFALHDPKIDGWFTTEDLATFENHQLKSIRRGEDFVKIGGENVDLLRLNAILSDVRQSLNIPEDMAIIALPDPRLGHGIHLTVATTDATTPINACIEQYHQRVFPFERIQKIHFVPSIPRSPLNKVLRKELGREISEFKVS